MAYDKNPTYSAVKEDLRTIIVTGASSGIGAYCARALRTEGWRVFATARKPEDIAALEADGIEAFYPAHTRDQTAFCLELCAERNLTPTGSSDFHGPTHKTFARFGAYDTFGLGEPQVPPPRRDA